MMNFLERLLGRPPVSETPRVADEPRRENAEILALREMNLRKALDAYLERTATDEEFATARAEMTGGDATRDLEPLTMEEMRGRVSRIWQKLGRVPEAVPVGDVYAPMGNRQGNFEASLAKALGRNLTEADLAEAREMFEHDGAIQKKWKTMMGEEVANYARTIARQLLSEQLRESADDHEKRFGIASK